MVYTVTLNPALDRTLFVNSLVPNESNRIQREARYAGGKGIDVSRALVEMDVPTVALGLVGGFDGKEFEGRLLNEGVACDFTRVAGEVRTNIIIHEESGDHETALLAQGPEIEPVELMSFIDQLEQLSGGNFLVASGSLPRGLTPAVYRRVIGIGNDRGMVTVLDSSGEALRQGITARPRIIKPNRSELAELAGEEFPDLPAVLRFCRTLQEQVPTILVSLGAEGMLLVESGQGRLAVPPKVEVKSTVGAGDCAVAGFVAGLSTGESPDDCLRRAVAAGTAATLTPGTGICCKSDIKRLMQEIKLSGVEA
ncbi:MAG: 1-phosphofructokinase [bacterium]